MQTIYRIIDPITCVVLYVGRAVNLNVRKHTHMTDCHSATLECALKGITDAGHIPIFETIEVVETSAAHERETYWIAYYLDLGVDLYNKAQRGGRISERPHEVLPHQPREKKPRSEYRKHPVIIAAQQARREEASRFRFLKDEQRSAEAIARNKEVEERREAARERKIQRATQADAATYDALEKQEIEQKKQDLLDWLDR